MYLATSTCLPAGLGWIVILITIFTLVLPVMVMFLFTI